MALWIQTRLTLVLALLVGCGAPAHRYSRAEASARLAQLETPGLVIGELPLHRRAVIDGDTIRVAGLDASLRLIGLDAEETFKHDRERRAHASVPFREYLRRGRGGAPRPVKLPTPLGDEARRFAERFFAGVTTVRLERDHPGEVRDFYDRYLAYVLVERDGRWLNYNVECVRAGMSPYFSKYGYSRRFHADFVAAQDEARAARRGIWSEDGQHYDDYPERLAWWSRRADEIAAFERAAAGRDDHIVLTRADAVARLEAHVGEEVVLFGAVGEVAFLGRGVVKVTLPRRRDEAFELVFFDRRVFARAGLAARAGEYVAVRGVVSRYRSRSGRASLQIVVRDPGQVRVPGEEGDRAR